MIKSKSQESKSKKQPLHWVKQLLFLFFLILFMLFIILWGLRLYTRHGQKIELMDLNGLTLSKAEREVSKNDFNLIVNDSIFIVGKPGGIIISQNPKPGSFVKKDRKIYLTITKYNADVVLVKDLPEMYGNAYDQKKKELEYRDINATIKSYNYDSGEPNHILEVWYKNELIIDKNTRKSDVEISKGDVLEFVLSERGGGEIPIPQLRCLSLEAARFILESNKLAIGDITKKSDVKEGEPMYVVSQSPAHDGISNIIRGEKISVTISGIKPVDCN